MNNLPDNRMNGRLLIFIVAYNAENTIENVLSRIPGYLADDYEVEVLIIDDSSRDETFKRAELAKHRNISPFKITVLFNPVNQGYGGNQKIGYHYAIENRFDWVALLHGDGQYAPECLPELVSPLSRGEADAVFGSRMMRGTSALKGGMPLYKFAGNKILTWFQNRMLGTGLSEFHSGYRLYSIQALKEVHFDLNSNDFHFDTEIIIQLVTAGMRIREIPIPTFYGDEICYVNGLHYAWNVFMTTTQAKLQHYNITYCRKFDCIPAEERKRIAELRMRPVEAAILEHLRQNSKVLISGTVRETFSDLLKEHHHHIVNAGTGELAALIESDKVDYLIIFNDSELIRDPKGLLNRLHMLCRYSPGMEIVIHCGNVGYFWTRMRLFFGKFTYSAKGVMDQIDAQLVTRRSAVRLFSQNGFTVTSITGLPFPYDILFKNLFMVRGLKSVGNVMISLRKSLFSYQFVFFISPEPSLQYLLTSAIKISGSKKEEIERETR
ncbi:MAG: glycosyltransferase family 2 protein [Desulfobulbaceae bacterium]|nr:glycosyltransferase family 2 protein [Desulfobulbaceae bacterium]